MKAKLLTLAVAFMLASTTALAAIQQDQTQNQTGAAASNQPSTIDPAYLSGYQDGYQAGQSDRQAGVSKNPHKFQAYQEADDGYTADYGPRADYSAAYRSGFDDGYADGYDNRPSTIGNTPVPVPTGNPEPPPANATQPTNSAPPANPVQPANEGAPPATNPVAPVASPSTPPPSATQANPNTLKRATGIGYREGYSAGQFDSGRKSPYNYSQNSEYTQASAGYDNSLGSFADYQANFRNGFRLGYDDGYHHRLYNAQIGIRTDATAPPVNATTSSLDPLPTTEEALLARPSGIYSNGILLAEGTMIQTRLNTSLNTKDNRAGDPFTATVSVPVWISSTMVIPAGSTIQGAVEKVQRAGAFHGSSEILLQYNTLNLPGGASYQLTASTQGVGNPTQSTTNDEGTVQQQRNSPGGTVAKSGGMGAIVGAIFGGGRGAILGGLAGAAVGTGGVLLSHNKDMALHNGELLTIRLDRPLELQPFHSQAASSQ